MAKNGGNGESGASAASGYDRAVAAAAAEEEAQAELNARINAQREATYTVYLESDAGAVAAQIAEAERLMHLPTPELHKELGTPESDPLKGPSS